MANRTEGIDPVLLWLAGWARARGLSREAVARTLGVKRPTVAGWFLGLEAAERNEPAPKSVREFRFDRQRAEVQSRIAEVLDQPIARLRAASRAPVSELPVAPPPVPQPQPGTELWDVVESMIWHLAGRSLDRSPTSAPGARRHRIAEVVESVPGVVGTSVIGRRRGSIGSDPYQYQVLVHAAPPAAGADGHGYRRAEEYVRGLRGRIGVALSAASLGCQWEHGVQQPRAQVLVGDQTLLPVGSLICPNLSGTRPPRTGLDRITLGAVLSSPYGGSGPIGGLLGLGLGAGHLRSGELVRETRSRQARRGAADDRGPFLGALATRDAGFILQVVLSVLERGGLPGTWLMSLESEMLAFEPLAAALERMPGPLIVGRLGPAWRRLAAWRLAAAALNGDALAVPGMPGDSPVSGDWIDLADGRAVTSVERAVLEAHQARAAQWLATIDGWEAAVDGLVERRTGAGRPTRTMWFDQLPGDLRRFDYVDGTYRVVDGEPPPDRPTLFCDDVDGMADAWAVAAADAADDLAALSGAETGYQLLLDPDGTDPVSVLLRRRHGGGAG